MARQPQSEHLGVGEGTAAAPRAGGFLGRMTRGDSLRRATLVVWLAIGLLILCYAGFWVLGRPLAVLVPPLLLAFLIVYLLNPVVTALASRGVPRLAGSALSYVLLAALVATLIATLVPLLSRQVANFTDLVPELGTQLVNNVNGLLASLGITARIGSLDGQVVGEQVQSLLSSEQIRTAAVALLGGLSGLATGAFHVLLVGFLGPVIAFYLLVDLPRLAAVAWEAVPPTSRGEVHDVATRLGGVVGGFVRGQLLVALFVGTTITIGLAVVGLPFWLLIGVIAGITNIVPLIGPFVAGVLGVTVALFTGGVPLAVLVLIVLTVVQQVDNHLISPLVMGRTVHVHPLMVLLALLVAGTLYGIFGMLVAVPTVAGAKVLVLHMWRTRVPWAAEGPDGEKAGGVTQTGVGSTVGGATAGDAPQAGAPGQGAEVGARGVTSGTP